MIPALLAILAAQLAGEALARASGLPMPGPVFGMILMLVGLILSAPLRDLIRPVASGILGNLLIMFVPAGVGAAMQIPSLGPSLIPVLVTVLISTVLAITAGALTWMAVARLTDTRPEGRE